MVPAVTQRGCGSRVCRSRGQWQWQWPVAVAVAAVAGARSRGDDGWVMMTSWFLLPCSLSIHHDSLSFLPSVDR